MPGMWVGTCFAQQQRNRQSDAGTGGGVPFLVGAASPERRKLSQEFDGSSVLLSVMGALSVLVSLSMLLGCDMINTCCCLWLFLCACEV